jgi:hypothetical protein
MVEFLEVAQLVNNNVVSHFFRQKKKFVIEVEISLL